MHNILNYITSQMSGVEIVASVATLVNVYLVIKNNIWCWPWGVVSVVLYGYVFYASKLYSSAGLQVVYYLPMQFIGWWVWLRCGPNRDDDLPITALSPAARLAWFAVNLPLAAALGYVMSRFGAALSYWDALVTAMSVTGQYLLTRKYVENWILWIVVDVIYAFYLLPAQKLYVSTGLYVLLLIMAILGLIEWLKIMRQQVASGVPIAE